MQNYSHSPTEVVDPKTAEGEVVKVVVFMAGFKRYKRFNFRCTNCGFLVFTYDDVISAISYKADIPDNLPFQEKMCGRCRWIFCVV